MVITRAQAEEIAARWARGESGQRGYECEPAVDEFDQGFVIWTRQPAEVLPIPGDGARTVIDRETGVVTTWPSLPTADVAALYRDHRPAKPVTVDPSVGLLRMIRRGPAPTTVAHLTVGGRLFRAQGAQGDQEINHHPLVAAHLATLTPGTIVRGAERHAELIVLSDALHAIKPKNLDEARASLLTAGFEAFLVREKDDPQAAQPTRPCETCLAALVDFALLPWSDLAYTAEWRHVADRVPPGNRFPAEVARILAAGGWTGPDEPLGAAAIDRAIKAAGGRLKPFPAARRAVTDFPGVRCARRGSGRRRAIRQLTLDPVPGASSAAALTELGKVLDTALFPIGVEGNDAILAVDEESRVFLLDQAGDWFIGNTVDEAVIGLLTGDGPAARLRDDGRW